MGASKGSSPACSCVEDWASAAHMCATSPGKENSVALASSGLLEKDVAFVFTQNVEAEMVEKNIVRY